MLPPPFNLPQRCRVASATIDNRPIRFTFLVLIRSITALPLAPNYYCLVREARVCVRTDWPGPYLKVHWVRLEPATSRLGLPNRDALRLGQGVLK